MLPRTASQSNRNGAEPCFSALPKEMRSSKILEGNRFPLPQQRGNAPFSFFRMAGLRTLHAGFLRHGKAMAFTGTHAAPTPSPLFPIRKLHSPAYLAPFSEEHLILLITNRIRKPWNHRLFLKRFTFFCLRKKCESQERIPQTS